MTELLFANDGPDGAGEETFDFSSPEDVLIEVIKNIDDGPDDWKNCIIETCSVMLCGEPPATRTASGDSSITGCTT
jgi:hypothetical protein